MLKQAVDLVNNSEVLALASINEDGYPRVCIVTKLDNQGVKKIYIATGTSSNKTKHFIANPKSSISCYDTQSSVILIGHMHIVTCQELKDSLWQDCLYEHVPGGSSDPEYCVLEFVPTSGSMCVQGQIYTVELE